MVQVKICGLKRILDIEYVNELKPEYVGFVFADSRRKVDPEMAVYLISHLDKNIKKVGIFVDVSISDVDQISKICGLDVLQFHGSETPEYCRHFDKTVWKAVNMNSVCSFDMKEYDADGFVLDSSCDGCFGGTGKPFEWNSIKNVKLKKDVILAGGLTSENVNDAIRIVNPDVVDVSSGVETDGKKDYMKIKKFIGKVRNIHESK